MALYTFVDTKDAQNPTASIVVAAGEAHIGDTIDITAAELTRLGGVANGPYDLRAGTVSATPRVTPFKRKK